MSFRRNEPFRDVRLSLHQTGVNQMLNKTQLLIKTNLKTIKNYLYKKIGVCTDTKRLKITVSLTNTHVKLLV